MPPKKKSPSKPSPRKKKPSGGRSRKKQPSRGKELQTRTLLAALGVLGFLVLSLIFLSQISPRPPAPAPIDSVQVTPAAEDLKPVLMDLLARNEIGQDQVKVFRGQGEYREFRVASDFPSEESLDALQRELAEIPGAPRVDLDPERMEIRILAGASAIYRLRFQPDAPRPLPSRGPRVAIIMDDLGQHLSVGRALLELDLEVTWAILPGLHNAAELAELGSRSGKEILVHLPMEPKGYPVTNPGGDALFCRQSEDEVRRRTEALLDRLPQATGGNNHMGSRFTEDRRRMSIVLEVMRRRGLFFVDSLTSAGSVAYGEARKAGMPAAVRDVFLDNEQDVEAISAQIIKLAKLAQRSGTAVGICHPYPSTLEALRRQTATLKEMGVQVVPVSELLIR